MSSGNKFCVGQVVVVEVPDGPFPGTRFAARRKDQCYRVAAITRVGVRLNGDLQFVPAYAVRPAPVGCNFAVHDRVVCTDAVGSTGDIHSGNTYTIVAAPSGGAVKGLVQVGCAVSWFSPRRFELVNEPAEGASKAHFDKASVAVKEDTVKSEPLPNPFSPGQVVVFNSSRVSPKNPQPHSLVNGQPYRVTQHSGPLLALNGVPARVPAVWFDSSPSGFAVYDVVQCVQRYPAACTLTVGSTYTISALAVGSLVCLVGHGDHYFPERFTLLADDKKNTPPEPTPTVDPHAPGAKLDAGKLRPALVLGGFANALLAVTKVGTDGAAKYSDNGWQHVPNGQARYAEAEARHRLRRESGEVTDDESGSLHLAHEAWNALAKLELYLRGTK